MIRWNAVISTLLFLCGILSSAVFAVTPTEDGNDTTIYKEGMLSLPSFDTASQPLLAQSSAIQSTPNCSEWNADNRLECWLWQLQVDIPPESFSKDWISISIKDMVCNHFVLQDLSTNYQSPHNLQLAVNTLQATCKGKYHASGGLSGHVQATVTTQSSSTSTPLATTSSNAIQLGFRISPSISYKVQRPNMFNTTQCQTLLKATNIHFTGSASAQLIQAFSRTIGHYVTNALQDQLCPLFPSTLDPIVTKYLHILDDWIQPYIQPTIINDSTVHNNHDHDKDQEIRATIPFPTPLRSTTMTTSIQRRTLSLSNNTVDTDKSNPVDWNVVHWTLELINQQLRDHLQQGWLFKNHATTNNNSSNSSNSSENCHPGECQDMYRGISGWIHSLVGSMPNIPLPLYFHNISLPSLPAPLPTANLSIGIHSISVQGLDQLETLQVLRPTYDNSSNQTLLESNVVLHASSNTGGSNYTPPPNPQGLYLQIPMVLDIRMNDSHNKNDDYYDETDSTNSYHHSLREPFTVKVNISQLEMTITSAIQVMDWNRTSLLQVALAIQKFSEHPTPENIQSTLGCLVRTLDRISNIQWITNMVWESISIQRESAIHDDDTTSGESALTRLTNGGIAMGASLEEDLDNVINSVLELFLKEYSQLWTLLSKGFIQKSARTALNQYVSDWIHHHASKSACPLPTNPLAPFSATDRHDHDDNNDNKNGTDHSSARWVNFTKFVILDRFNDFLNQESTIHAMNSYMSCVGKALEGQAQTILGKAQKHALSSSLATSVQKVLHLSSLESKNWDSVKSIQLFKPVTDTTLLSSLQWGTTSSPDGVPQIVAIIEVTTSQVTGTVNLTLFTGLDASVGTMIDYNLNKLQNLTVAQFLQEGQCGVVPMAEMRLLPNMTWANLGSFVGLNVSALLNNQQITYSTNDYASGTVPKKSATVLGRSVEWIRTLVNEALEQWIVESPGMCPISMSGDGNAPDNDDPSSSWYDHPILWLIIVMVVAGQGGIVWIANGVPVDEIVDEDNKSDKQQRQPLLRDTDDEIMGPVQLEENMNDAILSESRELDNSLLKEIQNESDEGYTQFILEEQDFLADDSEEGTSLLESYDVPTIVRFTIPILIAGTVVLLFSSNVSVGASVDMVLRLGETAIHIPALFEFSLGNTVIELYKAGIYPLLALVVVFSGIWPYAKLVWMFYIWARKYTLAYKREQRLLTLDALSKFSLVDTYVLVVMLVAFRFHLDVSDDLDLDVYVTPKYGFYAFLLATCLSLVLGHGMLYFHRKEKQAAYRSNESESEEKTSVFDHSFNLQLEGQKQQLSRCFQIILLACCLSATAFLMIGYGQKSFTFEFGGLAGMALGDKKRMTYSVVSMGASISQSVENPLGFFVQVLQLAYFFYAVVTPIACSVLLMALLMYPMTRRVQERVLVAAEIANAWGAVEVFLLSIVAALFQISTFASFIIGDKCDLVNRVAESLIGGNIIPPSDAVCFSVVASVESNCWYLVLGVLLNSFVASIGLRLAHVAVNERIRPNVTSDHITVAGFLFRLPLGCLLFDHKITEVAEEAGDGGEGEEEEEVQPDWRYWF